MSATTANAATAAHDEPRVRRELSNYGIAIFWGIITLISAILSGGSLIWMTWLLGSGEAQIVPVVLTTAIGFALIVGFVMATIGLLKRYIVTGFIGLGLVLVSIVALMPVALLLVGPAELFGTGWIGIIISVFAALGLTSLWLTVRRAHN